MYRTGGTVAESAFYYCFSEPLCVASSSFSNFSRQDLKNLSLTLRKVSQKKL